MTAADILKHWSPIAPVFGYKPEAWIRLLKIAASGENGCVMCDLFPRGEGWHPLKFWRVNGIIEVRDVRDGLNRERSRIFITKKGLDLLRLERA